MKELRPEWSTTVGPEEYDIDAQMEAFVRAANKAQESYHDIDVGKLWGLYQSWKDQRSALADAAKALETLVEDIDNIGDLFGAEQKHRDEAERVAAELKRLLVQETQ